LGLSEEETGLGNGWGLASAGRPWEAMTRARRRVQPVATRPLQPRDAGIVTLGSANPKPFCCVNVIS